MGKKGLSSICQTVLSPSGTSPCSPALVVEVVATPQFSDPSIFGMIVFPCIEQRMVFPRQSTNHSDISIPAGLRLSCTSTR